jgi:hypothetical protein
MRPPYGAYNDLVRRVASERGQKVTIWDFDSRDSLGASAAESKQLYTDAANRRPSTLLALNHEVYGALVSFYFLLCANLMSRISIDGLRRSTACHLGSEEQRIQTRHPRRMSRAAGVPKCWTAPNGQPLTPKR